MSTFRLCRCPSPCLYIPWDAALVQATREMVASSSGAMVWLLFIGFLGLCYKWYLLQCVAPALGIPEDSPGCWLAEGFRGHGFGHDHADLVTRRQPPLGFCRDVLHGKFWHQVCPLSIVRWEETEITWTEPGDLPRAASSLVGHTLKH